MEQNSIGKRLMGQEFNVLVMANFGCDMCQWLENGYETCDSINEIEAYACEILLHRRSFHIASVENLN